MLLHLDDPEGRTPWLDWRAWLAANGEPSRDLQVWLESTGYAEPTTPSHAPRQDDRASTLLGRVQAWTDGAEDNPTDSPWADLAACGSLEVHACHGALRQCEALRDELLRRFAADPTLEPRHVLVMTPDVATHAPLLAAVFARHGDGVPQLPLHIADLGLRAQNPVADALAQLLGLADERVTASRLLEVIASAPVRRRFALREDDVAELRAMVVGSGIRWAWDAADRERHGQPAIDQNTVRFGLERLALGVLMHDLGGLDVVPGPAGSDLAPAVPFDVAGRDGVERFGRLADLFDRLRAVRGRVIEPATSAGWRARLTELIDDFTEVEGESAWLRVEVEEALAELFPDDLGEGLPLDRSAVAATLAGAFDRPLRGDRPITGAITVCALEPMRSVPFRVIAILGLDDGAFPRPGRTPAWDPFAARKHGEYDRRTIDRHLFLEAVLCARDALLLFGTGFEPSRGAPAPMSVVVSELVEVIAAGTGEAPKARRVDHPLQPWSEKAFAAGEGAAAPRLPFDAVWVDAAVAIRGPRRLAGLAATPLDAPWPAEDGETNAIRADELARALARPQEELLRRRLGLSLAPEDATVPDREPLDQGTLEAWSLRDRVLRATEGGADPDVDALEARLRGEGALQLRAGGRRALEGIVGEAREARRRAEAVPGVRTEALQASCEVGGVVVSAAAADVRLEDGDRRLVWVTASKGANGRAELTAWVTLIVAVAAGEAVVSAHVCGHGKEATLHAPSAADARAHLDALVRTWREVRGGPIPLFPALSRAVALRLAKDAQLSPAGAVEASDAAWSGSSMAAGDHEDPWVSAIFGHLGIEDLAERATEVCERAVRVWGPVLAAGTDAKGANEPEGSDAEDA